VGLVLLAHLAGLEWLARQRQPPALQAMAPPMFTRLLQPQAPAAPPAAPPPAPRPVARAPEPPRAAVVQDLPAPAQVEAGPPAEPPTEAQPAVAAVPEPAASAPQPAIAADPSPPLASWPADTRLTYELGGRFRSGPLFGGASVQWQRAGEQYQVRLDLRVKYFGQVQMTSQGRVTGEGLQPRAYEELRPATPRRSAQFDEHGVTLDRGRRVSRPPRTQDTVSQFVELAWRFATGRETLEVGGAVQFPLVRPEGVDEWTYDVVARELVQTPAYGAVEAFHLKPRPLARPRGNITAEMWIAPSLQYLPVRILVKMGDEVELDLVVEKIEQR
jgi:hypothetical protein